MIQDWSLLFFIWWLLKEPFCLFDAEPFHFFLLAVVFLAAAGFLTSFFVPGFFVASLDFAAVFFVADGFFTAGFLDVSFLEDGLLAGDFFLGEVCFLAAGFLAPVFFVVAGFLALTTVVLLLGAAGFLDGFFCSFGSLNDPEAPTPLVWMKVPLAAPFLRAVLMCWAAVSPTLKLALMYFSMA